ncbi:MAG TPA: TonB family protein [Bryobacteraceae bacterium]|nr:TonB family protein [Bryobacteraceae bacterium]
MELLPWVAKSTLLLALAFAAVVVLRKGSADLRHLVWRAVFAALLLLPLTVQLAPEWTPAAAPDAPVRTVITVFAGEPVEAPAERRWPLEWIWAVGAGVLLLREAARWARGQWVVSKSVEFGGDARVRLSEQVAVPAVYGIWRPVILLPAAAREWSEERLRVVLAHERMHILRGDPAWFTAARVAAALWWPHPLVWLGLVCLIREAEQACDDGVLAEGTPADEYATHLVAMVRTISVNEVRYQGGLPMIRVSELERRLRAMLNPGVNRRPAARGTLVAVLLAVAFVMAPLSSLRAPGQSAGEASVRGVVEDAEGRPVERALVEVRRFGAPRPVREVVRTDATGTFRLDGLPEGSYAVTVNKEGFGTVQISSMRVSASAPSRLRVQLQPAGDVQPMRVPPPQPVARAEGAAEAPAKLAPPPMPKQISVGGGVQRMRLVTKVDPVYPAEVKAAGIEGVVILEAVIAKDGAVQSVERVNKLVDDRLADAAIEAVKQWKYQPTLLNGEPVEVKTQIDVNFTLAEQEEAARPGAAQGGAFRIGGGVSAPQPIFKVEPEYSEEARAAGFQGRVMLSTVIDAEGTPTQIKVVRPLGMGLDEKAIEALAKWKFRPATKEGKPVAVISNVEMSFRLLKPPQSPQ